MGAKLAKGFFITTILVLVCNSLFAQWADNFDDGDFTNNLEWVGDTNNFIIESGVLRLNAPAQTGIAHLATSSDISLNASWRFLLTLDFNPSSSNYAMVYLMADVQDLNFVQNGYFVKVGGAPDEISLYKVVEGNETLLIDGVDGRVGLPTVEIEIIITRNSANKWEVKSKLAGEPDFTSEGNIVDSEVVSSAYFGVFCKYTSTRSTLFYFDDIIVLGSPFVDNEPPELLYYSTPTSSQILLAFSETLDTTSVIINTQFLLNNTETPTNIFALNSDTILISFNTKLEMDNSLEILAIPDVEGNLLDTMLQIVFIDPTPSNYRDIVINELFPDPNPQEDLPPFEFVELFNNTNRIIDLKGWEFTDGSKVATFSSVLVYPDSFLIICPVAAEVDFIPFGKTVGLDIWPALNNGGDALVITGNNGTIIDSLTYSSSWYNNAEKENGGWTLEQLNPASKCLGSFNWGASINEKGGTPGMVNSLYPINADFSPPQITQALLTETLAEVWLTEPVTNGLYQGVISSPLYNITFDLAEPSAYLKGTIEDVIHLNTYNIEIYLQDCNGNTGIANSLLINIANPATEDIVINEILFDPYYGGSDFVEIYNNSDRYFNLKDYKFSNETSNSVITDTTLLLEPKHYLALSENIVFLKNEYLSPDSSLFKTELPTMPNNEGMIVLKSAKGIIIDSVVYNEDYHFSLIDDVEGVSLERISSAVSSISKDNWRSTAESFRYATPGYKNSQSREPVNKGVITVSPEIITPNNDGQSDYCQIGYSADSQSQTISISIYNLQGQLVKPIANNVLISPSGFFTWDGTNQQGGILTTAHYIIVSEIITSDGRVLTFRNKVVVANGF